MIDKETRAELIRLHAMGMTIVVDKPNLGVDIVEHENSFYRISFCQLLVDYGVWLIAEVTKITEEITVWEEKP